MVLSKWACVGHLGCLDSLLAFSEGETAQVGISALCEQEGLGLGRPQREAGGQGRQRALFNSGHTCQPPPPAFFLFLLFVSLLPMTPYKVHSPKIRPFPKWSSFSKAGG